MRQALYFVNSEHLEGKIASSPTLKALLDGGEGDSRIVERLYLTMLTRLPSADESKVATEYLARDPKARPQSLRDLVWALCNTKEFLFNH